MSSMAALQDADVSDYQPLGVVEPFLPLQLATAAEAAGGLIANGLATRVPFGAALTDARGVLRPEIAPLARAYEAALLSGLSPAEVKTLRRLLARVEAAALKLSGRG